MRLPEECLKKDPEWTTQYVVHIRDVIEAFIVGTVRSSDWSSHEGIQKDLEKVTRWIARCTEIEFKNRAPVDVSPGSWHLEVCKLSLLEILELLRDWAVDHPITKSWEIDLDEMVYNAAVYIRNLRRMAILEEVKDKHA